MEHYQSVYQPATTAKTRSTGTYAESRALVSRLHSGVLEGTLAIYLREVVEYRGDE